MIQSKSTFTHNFKNAIVVDLRRLDEDVMKKWDDKKKKDAKQFIKTVENIFINFKNIIDGI